MTNIDIRYLKNKAKIVRQNILHQIYYGGSGHPGGSLSCVEILVALFANRIQPDQKWHQKSKRDYVILSKGHASPALYGTYAAVDLIDDEELKTFRKLGSRLQGHPDYSRFPLVEISTGSLGQGLSVGLGIAFGLERQSSDYFSFVILGDGEMNSGQIWEAVACAGVKKAKKLVAILDANGLQNDGSITEIFNILPYKPKLEEFGWAVKEIDGQNIKEVCDAIEWATSSDENIPHFIIAKTIKGAGVSFMEDRVDWHSHSLSDKEYQAALKEVL